MFKFSVSKDMKKTTNNGKREGGGSRKGSDTIMSNTTFQGQGKVVTTLQ